MSRSTFSPISWTSTIRASSRASPSSSLSAKTAIKVTDASLKDRALFNKLGRIYPNHKTVTNAGPNEFGTTLDLGQTRVTDTGLKELKEFKSLTTLNLYCTRVTFAGVTELKGLKNLTTLELCGTQVGDAGCEEMKDLKNLTRLELGFTQVTDVGLRHLKGLNDLSTLDPHLHAGD